ncbi:MAG: DegT/DnrJ/EryC1/StrS family aminotransferase [Ferruginibacter sp.]|nr:DegT/DnrJ/EryC1/StrS family aminotransferase [Ferruginibacter sp.]
MINVTKTYLPNFDEYTVTLKRAWDKAWLTNNGELVLELEGKLKEYLGVENFLFTNNGTIVLQMALKVLGITKEVITTPFSYVATTNVIIWEGCKPVFVDIDPNTFCIDASKIEAAITSETEAILATHVFGINCDIETIEAIAKKYNLKVIYDAAHAFGSTYKGKSLLQYGDIITCSFHATKLFHTGEGGCIIANDKELANKLMLYRQFGHVFDDFYSIGINGKNSEFHAAMGLCVLPNVAAIIADRKRISLLYDASLATILQRPKMENTLSYNYAYYPVVFKSEEVLLQVVEKLKEQQISGRRYFYPSLNELPFIEKQPCVVSEDISRRVFCLPFYYGLEDEHIQTIITCILSIIKK